jgi:8-oxo-dGTP pyrophosphatase MutT (NUDIX family)
MVGTAALNPWQVFRTRLHLLSVALRKRQTVGARMALLDGDRVLLVRHTYVPGWQFPGGGVEPFETSEAAAVRETLEETGYAVGGRPRLHGLFLNRVAGGGRDHVALFVTTEFSQARAFAPNLEIARCEWFSMSALPPDTEPGTRARVGEIVAGTAPPAEW